MVKKSVSFAIGQSKPLNENVSMIDGPAVALANPCFRSTKLALAIPFFAGIKLTATMAVLVPELVSPNETLSDPTWIESIGWQRSKTLDRWMIRFLGKFLRVYARFSLPPFSIEEGNVTII